MILLGLGSNLGDRLLNLRKALDLLGYPVIRKAGVYETEPVEFHDQPWFLNTVSEISTDDSPRALLEHCLEVENALGRERRIAKGPRTIDIDLLFYNDVILETPELMLPHPGISHRKFVLVPLADIAPDLLHPVFGRTVSELLKYCMDESVVRAVHAGSSW